ncbi:hypothetical protein Bca101_056000 [Brassica carinata]
MAGSMGNSRDKTLSNKRPRSPIGGAQQRSPTRASYPGQSREGKRQKEADSYWTSKAFSSKDAPMKKMEKRSEDKEERYPYHQKASVWNRLDESYEGQDRRKISEYNARPRQRTTDRYRDRETYRARERQYSRYSHQSQASQQAWKPRSQIAGGKSCSPSRTVTNLRPQRASTPEKADSQQTISGGLQERNERGGHGNGVLVVHQNETAEERLRRLKGKDIMQAEPVSVKKVPHAILTRDRGTVVIWEGGNRSPPNAPRSVISPHRLRDESEEPCLDLDNLMNSKHIDNMVMSREEEADVEKLVDEFGDVFMDETMIQNDDLLGDEPGQDAEVIDAISQLSPANAVLKRKSVASGIANKATQARTLQTKEKIIGASSVLQANSTQAIGGSAFVFPCSLRRVGVEGN